MLRLCHCLRGRCYDCDGVHWLLLHLQVVVVLSVPSPLPMQRLVQFGLRLQAGKGYPRLKLARVAQEVSRLSHAKTEPLLMQRTVPLCLCPVLHLECVHPAVHVIPYSNRTATPEGLYEDGCKDSHCSLDLAHETEVAEPLLDLDGGRGEVNEPAQLALPEVLLLVHCLVRELVGLAEQVPVHLDASVTILLAQHKHVTGRLGRLEVLHVLEVAPAQRLHPVLLHRRLEPLPRLPSAPLLLQTRGIEVNRNVFNFLSDARGHVLCYTETRIQ
mmetsp:Transcript_2155/g.4936  ORF Transcript_2155/g.4936 Transcript_2155/m.4936 type:complete len:272 (-) Transcript_2155:2060-2875(-)